MWNGQSSVPTVSGGTQDSQLQHRVQHRTFPHFPSDHTPLLVRPHTQQQGTPPLTPRSPSGHTAGPGPAPLRAKQPYPQPRSHPSGWTDLRVLMLNASCTSSVQFSSVAQSCLTLRPHESQHARPPCPSPTPRVHSDSRPSSQ